MVDKIHRTKKSNKNSTSKPQHQNELPKCCDRNKTLLNEELPNETNDVPTIQLETTEIAVVDESNLNEDNVISSENSTNDSTKNENSKVLIDTFKSNSVEDDPTNKISEIPEVLRNQGSASFCSSNPENTCPCNTMEAVEQISKQITYCNRKTWITVERMNELRKKAQDALKTHKTFTIRGCFFSVRNALTSRGWVEKLDVHRKHVPSGVCQITYEDLTQTLPKRKPGETRRQYLIKCERNIMSRFLEHMPIDFLWTARKEKCDYIDQAKNPSMIINKFHRIPFTSKEGLCNSLKDFHWFYEEGTSELYFPRCYNVWSPEELSDFIENFRLSSCIGFLRWIVDKFRENGFDSIFSPIGKIPFTAIDFAFKRCTEFLDICNHNDIDNDEVIRVWEHDFDAFLTQHYLITQENARILLDHNRIVDGTIKSAEKILSSMQNFWPQYSLDGYLNLWIVKPANKCRGRGIQIFDNLKRILNMVNPAITSKSRYVVQKYIEKPLIIHNTKFDIRQWFLITSSQPMVIWMYKECYLRFSSQEYNLSNHHESVHLTNHAIQKKYKNGKRDKRLPSENMWDCYSFQAYLRQIGQQLMWSERIYPGMRRAIIGTMLASQDNMDRRTNTFELFGADFMISEDFYPWLIEINSSPDLGATTSVTARMCPQCLEDVIKVVIDRRYDMKADTGNFECIYRQMIPPTPAYMGLNLFLKGKQILPRNSNHFRNKDRISTTSMILAKQSMPSIHVMGNLSSAFSAYNRSDGTFLEKHCPENSSNINLHEIDNNDNDINDTTEVIQTQSVLRKSSLNFLRSTATNTITTFDTNNLSTLSQQTRLLTPLLTPQSSRRSSTQLVISPRGSIAGDRRRSSEWRHMNDNLNKPRISLPNTSQISKRHFSCGPRILPPGIEIGGGTLTLENSKEHLSSFNDITVEAEKFKCVGNKCSRENLILPESDANSTVTPSPRPTTPNSRKQIFDILYKSRSARMKRSTKTVVKTKSSPVMSSSAVISYRKTCLLNRKLGSGNNNDKSPLNRSNKERLSLRAWRSKQFKNQDNNASSVTNGREKSSSPLKIVSSASPIPRRSYEGGSRGCSTCPKKPSCKNMSKKISEHYVRINTRC